MQQKLIRMFQEVYGRSPATVTRAPGRVEFIGNHTDYNGGTVLGASIDRNIWVAIAPRDDNQRRFYSDVSKKIVALPAGSLAKQSGDASWVNYPLGVLAALPVFGLQAPAGFDYLAFSDLPVGAGLSSSAAIELASALAFLAMTGQHPDRETVVKIGKHAENNFVGVPCGILDQGVSGFGRKNHLVFIDCRGPRFDTVELPDGVHFWIFNTHTKHALVDGLYAERHRECMEAARLLGVAQLVDVTPSELEAAAGKLPPVIYKRALHVVREIDRVNHTVGALKKADLSRVGGLITASHRSSQVYFENSTPELDFLVDRLNATINVHGVRLTGGGFGGAVMAVTSPGFGATHAYAIADAYALKFGRAPDVLHLETGAGAEIIAL